MYAGVLRTNNGEVIVHQHGVPDIRLRNQEQAHTWLAANHYQIVGKSPRGPDDHISGTYVKVSRGVVR